MRRMLPPTPDVIGGLTKDASIRTVLTRLTKRFGVDSFAIADDWEADLFAIGIANPIQPRKRMYISTFRLAKGSYYCELEVETEEGSSFPYVVVGRFEKLDFEGLVVAFAQHLGSDDRG